MAGEAAGLGAAMVRQRGDLARLNALLADNTGQRDELASDTASLRAEAAAICKVRRGAACPLPPDCPLYPLVERGAYD